MWNVEFIEERKVELDFSSSGQGRRTVTAVSAAGIRLINAVELVEVTPSATQVVVCECCGTPHCEPGGWVTFRRIGEKVVWLPTWDIMEKGEWEMSEYSPPSYLHDRGALAFSAPAWDRLRALHSGLPDAQSLPQINSRETVRLCQWLAPGRILGTFPAVPRTRRELLIAVTNGELEAEAECVDQWLRDYYEGKQAMELVPQHVSVAPIEFWLELPGTPSWKSFAHIGTHSCCLIDDEVVLIQTGALPTADR